MSIEPKNRNSFIPPYMMQRIADSYKGKIDATTVHGAISKPNDKEVQDLNRKYQAQLQSIESLKQSSNSRVNLIMKSMQAIDRES